VPFDRFDLAGFDETRVSMFDVQALFNDLQAQDGWTRTRSYGRA
jgi:hypothetical protein